MNDGRDGATGRAFGLVVTDLSNPFFGLIATGAQRHLRDHGLELVIASSEDDSVLERRAVKSMIEHGVRGLLVVPASQDQAHLQVQHRPGRPLVMIDRPPVGLAADCVVLDNRGASIVAVHRLLAAGHRRIAALADSRALWTAGERLIGVRQALAESGLALDAQEFDGIGGSAAAQSLTTSLLRSQSPPTAFLCLNNRITLGVLAALSADQAPSAVIGFDDFEAAEQLGVSVLSRAPEDLGRFAVDLVLAHRDGTATPEPQQLVLPVPLIERGSGERRPEPRWRHD